MTLDHVQQSLIELNAKLDLLLLFGQGIIVLALIAALRWIWTTQRHSLLGKIVGYFLTTLRKKLRIPDHESPYLTVYGFVLMADGWGKISAGIIQALQHQVSIGFVHTRPIYSNSAVPKEIKKIVSKKKLPTGKVIIYTDCAWTTSKQPLLENLIADQNAGDQIRIAYSMFETNKIPYFWKSIIHRYFDAVVVPDPYFINVYKNSGIERPIFTLPISVDYRHFLSKPLKAKRSFPLVFADFGAFIPRKNHLTLIRAFAKAFQNQPDVLLRLNGRYAQGNWHQIILDEIRRLGLTQVVLTNKLIRLNDYVNLFQKVDCYINLSQGEGFSIPIREAMAQGIPVICVDNTALGTVCRSGLIRPVPSPLQETAYYHWVSKGYYGHFFHCTVDEAAAALRDVYDHYDVYLQRAEEARKWAEKYDCKQLMPLYRSLVKPRKVVLGHENQITEDYLMTDSKELYQKYL